MDVLVPVAHAAAIGIQDIIENRTVAFLNRLQFVQVVREELEVEGVHFGLLRDLLRDVVVVRYGVMSIRDAEERITERTEFARQHERLDASHGALESKRLQVKHQPNVLNPILRNTAWRIGRFNTVFGALLLALNDLPLNFSNIFEILIQLRHILRPKTFGQALNVVHNTVKNAGALTQLQGSLFFAGSIAAKHPLEDDARIQFHRQRLGRGTPADGAHVRAQIVAGAASEMAGMVFRRKLHGWKGAALTDLLRDHLIHRGVQLQHVAFVRNRAAEKRGAADRVPRFSA